MKRIIAVFLSFLLFLLTACSQQTSKGTSAIEGGNTMPQQSSNQEITSSTASEFVTEQESATKEVLGKKSTKEANELITKSYPQKELISFLSYQRTDNFNTLLYYLDEKYPVECIRTFDDALTYCIYQLEEGGLLYVYFHGALRFADYVFVVKKPLEKDDFESIKKGSSLEDVEEVDPGTRVINSIKKAYLSRKVTFHMVKDGFIKIRYTESGEFDINTHLYPAYTVKSIEFIPNGEILNDLNDDEYSYKLLPQDYIG